MMSSCDVTGSAEAAADEAAALAALLLVALDAMFAVCGAATRCILFAIARVRVSMIRTAAAGEAIGL
jgi:hypothetical protein